MPATKKSPLGDNIRRARESANKTQLELAHEVGWTGPDAGAQISRFESGKKEPNVTTLIKIANALGTTVSRLCQA